MIIFIISYFKARIEKYIIINPAYSIMAKQPDVAGDTLNF